MQGAFCQSNKAQGRVPKMATAPTTKAVGFFYTQADIVSDQRNATLESRCSHLLHVTDRFSERKKECRQAPAPKATTSSNPFQIEPRRKANLERLANGDEKNEPIRTSGAMDSRHRMTTRHQGKQERDKQAMYVYEPVCFSTS